MPVDRTAVERQRRWRAKIKAAAAPLIAINRVFETAAAANFAIDAIEFFADGGIVVRPKLSTTVTVPAPVQPDRDDIDDDDEQTETPEQ